MSGEGLLALIDAMKALAVGPLGRGSAAVQRMADEVTVQDPYKAEAITRWLRDRVRAPGPIASETLRSPERMVAEIAERGYCEGDVDDVAVLAAAMGLSMGMRVRFLLVALDGHTDPSGVFAQLKSGDGDWAENPVAGIPFASRVTSWDVFSVEEGGE